MANSFTEVLKKKVKSYKTKYKGKARRKNVVRFNIMKAYDKKGL